MKLSLRKGFSFGLTSAIITTLGLLIGLYSSTHSKSIVISGIIIIAIADALSDALGIHVSEESENKHTQKQIWESTFATFISKFVFASTFIIPIFIFNINTAVIISIFWGLLLISIASYDIAKRERIKPYKVIIEHILITTLVILATYFIGKAIPYFVTTI